LRRANDYGSLPAPVFDRAFGDRFARMEQQKQKGPEDDPGLRELVAWMLKVQALDPPEHRIVLPLVVRGEKIFDAKDRLVGLAHAPYADAIVKLMNEMGAQ
jgi:hypothetical protein